MKAGLLCSVMPLCDVLVGQVSPGGQHMQVGKVGGWVPIKAH